MLIWVYFSDIVILWDKHAILSKQDKSRKMPSFKRKFLNKNTHTRLIFYLSWLYFTKCFFFVKEYTHNVERNNTCVMKFLWPFKLPMQINLWLFAIIQFITKLSRQAVKTTFNKGKFERQDTANVWKNAQWTEILSVASLSSQVPPYICRN